MAASAALFATLLSACQADRGPSNKHYKNVVVNLSLAIVPGAVFEDFAAVNGTCDIATFEEYALNPAALPTAISVGSLDVTGEGYSSTRSHFPNAATVLAPGAWFDLHQVDGRTVAYSGTSFAATVASLFAAVDLLSEDRACDPGDLSIRPVTGHAMATTTLDGAPLVAGFGDGSGDYTASLFCSQG